MHVDHSFSFLHQTTAGEHFLRLVASTINNIDLLFLQVYLKKDGNVVPIGVDLPEFGDGMLFVGAVCYHSAQERLYKFLTPAIQPVFEKLHERGYFGLLSLDVLIDKVNGIGWPKKNNTENMSDIHNKLNSCISSKYKSL